MDNPEAEGSTAIYFDLLGLVMVSYPAWTGVLVTLVVAATAVSSLLHDINTISKKQDLQLHVIRSAVLAILLSFLRWGPKKLLLASLGTPVQDPEATRSPEPSKPYLV